MSELDDKMQKSLAALDRQLATLRTNRANPDMLATLQVEAYGASVPLQQVASVSVPEPMTLLLNVFDRNAVKDVERAIQASQLGLNPQVDGSIIRLRLPELTEDRRKDLVKLVNQYGEDARVSLRNARRDAIDKIKAQEKDKEISEDDAKREQEVVQKVTDDYSSRIDGIAKAKEKEILTI